MEENKIGLAVITYNRLDYLKQCIESLDKHNWGGATVKVVCDDGSTQEGYTDYLNELSQKGLIVKRNPVNSGVAVNKNEALHTLMDEGCTHLFLMEDDILMKYPKTCIKYIAYGLIHDLKHMNYALHGPLNKGNQRFLQGICVYPDSVGAFSYYHKDVIITVGYFDTNFKNAWEHVEHTFRISKQLYTTPFWYFADHPESEMMLGEIPGAIDNSSIRPRPDWQENIQKGREYWATKHDGIPPPRPQWS